MLPPHPEQPSATDLESVCADARRMRQEADAGARALRDARRELIEATRRLDAAALDADRHRIAAEKAELVQRYRESVAAAEDPPAQQAAVAAWMRDVSDLNQRTRRAVRQLTEGRQTVAGLEARVSASELAAAAARIRAEGMEAACTDARQRLAALEGARLTGADAPPADDALVLPAARPATDGPTTVRRPLVESPALTGLLGADRDVTEAIASELAEMSGSVPARYLLLLDTFVEELAAAAVDAGALSFDHDHPFWGRFEPDEALALVQGLRSLGFRLDLHDGWYGGRAPTANDLAAALGFAGRDLRGLRGVPSAPELRDLPGSIHVAPHDHLRRVAPDLTLEQVTCALGPRAARLGDLWNEWGRVRAVLAEAFVAPAVEGVAAAV